MLKKNAVIKTVWEILDRMLLENVNASELDLFLECRLQWNVSWKGLPAPERERARKGRRPPEHRAPTGSELLLGLQPRGGSRPLASHEELKLSGKLFAWNAAAPLNGRKSLYFILPLSSISSLPLLQTNSSSLVAVLWFYEHFRLSHLFYSRITKRFGLKGP